MLVAGERCQGLFKACVVASSYFLVEKKKSTLSEAMDDGAYAVSV